MKHFRKTTMSFIAIAFAVAAVNIGLVTVVDAQRRAVRVSDRQVEQIIRSVEQRSDTFRRSFDAALDRSRLDGTYKEDNANAFVSAFENATNDLRSRFNGHAAVAADVENVLSRAAVIDGFMRNNLRQARVQGDWTLLRGDLQRLANAYSVAFNMNGEVLSPVVVASQRAYRVSDSQLENILRRVETKTDTFKRSLNGALDRSRMNNTQREDNINAFVSEFENSTDELRRKFDGRTSVDLDVSNVIVRAVRIDDFMGRNLRRETVVQRNWRSLSSDLNMLANYYSLGFNLNNRRNMPPYSPTTLGSMPLTPDELFTGTYRLNSNQSENAETVVNNAMRNLRQNNQVRMANALTNRLRAPQMLAMERHGNRLMLASSVSPQLTLDVDGLEHAEQYPNGRPSRVRASLVGDTLTVVSNGDRANDFSAVFTSIDGGRRMMVTRSLYAEGINRPVEVKTYYDRVSDTARFDIVDTQVTASNGPRPVNGFLVPNNTMMVAVLHTNLSTRTARNGDRFTMTVRSPSQYAGAVIEGYVSNAERSGRATGRSEMNLNYETLRMPDNRTYRFAGILENVRTHTGENVLINNEGTLREGDSQTNRTIGRTAIGAGIGALFGALLGGGDGAAVGAAVGAGTGIGSVYIQGRDDLELSNGAEFTIRTTAPFVG